MAVRLEFPLASPFRGVEPVAIVPVRTLGVAELEALQGADEAAMIGAVTGLSADQVSRLTANDIVAIQNARRART